MADCQDLCVYKRLKTYIQWIVYFKSLVEDSLQKGKIISLTFHNGYTDVLSIVGGINVQR